MISPTNEHVEAVLSDHGVPRAMIRKVINMREHLRAQDLGKARSDDVSDEVKQINSSIQKVGVQIREYRDEADQRMNGLQANMQGIEQKLAMLEHGGSGISLRSGGPAAGEKAVKMMLEDSDFKSLALRAEGGMSVGAFDVRVKVGGGIRNAIVNENGTSGVSSTFPAQPERTGIFGPVLPHLTLIDALPHRPTTRDSVEFVQVGVTGNAGVQESEGAEKEELEFNGELETAQIVTIAGHTTASTQVLADVPALEQLINNVLSQKVRLKLENQLMNGSGIGQNIDGLLMQAAAILPTIATTPADAYGEVMLRMADEGFSPSLAIMNPLDWYQLLLTRKSAVDQSYVFGSPIMPIPPALWNTRVVLTSTIAEGNGLVIDPGFVTVLDRELVSVAVSRHHKDNFTRNLITILAELRAGLEVTNQNALRKFTLPPGIVS